MPSSVARVSLSSRRGDMLQTYFLSFHAIGPKSMTIVPVSLGNVFSPIIPIMSQKNHTEKDWKLFKTLICDLWLQISSMQYWYYWRAPTAWLGFAQWWKAAQSTSLLDHPGSEIHQFCSVHIVHILYIYCTYIVHMLYILCAYWILFMGWDADQSPKYSINDIHHPSRE